MTSFGPRYGKRIKQLRAKIDKKSHSLYRCPSCSRVAVKRDSAGVWICKKCKMKYASDSYEFSE